jgi:molecular chaperone GrpE
VTGDAQRPGAEEEVVTRIRDRRRIDPVTGAVRVPESGAAGGPTGPAADEGPPPPGPGGAEAALAERTADLQRLKAEYDNYRRRVERDRLAVAEQALASVLAGLLPVLDDIARARAHGEVEGGFKPVADGLEATVGKLGLVVYGEPGDPFDPAHHEALMHEFSTEVSEPTCVRILEPGYRLGERVLRPARVAVAEPPFADAPSAGPASGEPEPAPAPGESEAAPESASAGEADPEPPEGSRQPR